MVFLWLLVVLWLSEQWLMVFLCLLVVLWLLEQWLLVER